MRCECAILSSMACPALQTFFFPPYYVINGSIYEKRYIEHKMCVSIFPTTLFERFFILRRIEQDTIKMYVGLYVKYPLFLTFNVYGSVHRKYIPIYTYIYTYIYIYPTRCNFTPFIYIWKLLYMFRLVPPPIIRSAYNCIYNIWYLSHRYYYLPL